MIYLITNYLKKLTIITLLQYIIQITIVSIQRYYLRLSIRIGRISLEVFEQNDMEPRVTLRAI